MREGPTTKKHKEGKKFGKAAIITLSDSRTIKEDDSGDLIAELLEKSGHRIADRIVIPDNEASLRSKIKSYTSYAKDQDIINIIITNGGTGISKKDVTIEAVKPMYTKEMSSFNPLFALLSYEDIGSSALLSRACAGIIGRTVIFSLPGSPKAVSLAMKKIILPELGHILKHLGD